MNWKDGWRDKTGEQRDPESSGHGEEEIHTSQPLPPLDQAGVTHAQRLRGGAAFRVGLKVSDKGQFDQSLFGSCACR
jgi:hypothetical protein